jgi:hypothetical protein
MNKFVYLVMGLIGVVLFAWTNAALGVLAMLTPPVTAALALGGLAVVILRAVTKHDMDVWDIGGIALMLIGGAAVLIYPPAWFNAWVPGAFTLGSGLLAALATIAPMPSPARNWSYMGNERFRVQNRFGKQVLRSTETASQRFIVWHASHNTARRWLFVQVAVFLGLLFFNLGGNSSGAVNWSAAPHWTKALGSADSFFELPLLAWLLIYLTSAVAFAVSLWVRQDHAPYHAPAPAPAVDPRQHQTQTQQPRRKKIS